VTEKLHPAAEGSGHRLLVAISPSPLSESMARWTCQRARDLRAPWIALFVDAGRPLSHAEQAALQKRLGLARELGAEVITSTGHDVVETILRVSRQHGVTQIVVGKPARSTLLELLRGGPLVHRLIRESGDIDIHCVKAGIEEAHPLRHGFPDHSSADPLQYIAVLGVVAVVTGLNAALLQWLDYYPLSLVYLMALVIQALFVGRGPVLVSAMASVLAWDFFFLPPRFSFHVASAQDAFAMFVFLVVALAMGHLTSQLRARQISENEREKQATALYLLTRELAEAGNLVELTSAAIRRLELVFDADVAILLPHDQIKSQLAPSLLNTFAALPGDAEIISKVYRSGTPADTGGEDLSSCLRLYQPLAAASVSLGVIGLRLRRPVRLTPQQRNLFESFANQISLWMERLRLRQAENSARLFAESERLGKVLLNSVSHELRTPLAAITSAASELEEMSDKDNPSLRRALSGEIREAGLRLNRFVSNLLGMTRLDSGRMKPRLEWCDVDDLINVSLRHVERELSGHQVRVPSSSSLPLVKMDFMLMQQVLINLLLNAAFHTPAGSHIEVKAKANNGHLVLAVADDGPGIPAEALPQLFGKFYRAPGAPAGGSGLGLSIVKGFVEAHGGRVQAANRSEGGAEFTVVLPAEEAPPPPEEPIP
jgi:two-component system sensor histidine kinase KdpD